MTPETVEWQVGRYDEQGRLVFTRDGAQSVFSKTRAEALARKRGVGWFLVHYPTGETIEAYTQAHAEKAAIHQESDPDVGDQ